LAYYHLTKDNILVNDLSTPNLFDKIANQQRSQGIELDITGHVTDALSLVGSYAFTDARIIKDFTGGTQGNRLNNVPEHSGSIWIKYDLNGYASMKGLSFGLGGIAAGQREGNNTNSFQMPGYVRMDAFAAYKWDFKKTRVTAQFNIRNLLDKQYYAYTEPSGVNVDPALGVYPGAPLTAIGSIKVEF
jgi:iron complex outermembrane receptor protein